MCCLWMTLVCYRLWTCTECWRYWTSPTVHSQHVSTSSSSKPGERMTLFSVCKVKSSRLFLGKRGLFLNLYFCFQTTATTGPVCGGHKGLCRQWMLWPYFTCHLGIKEHLGWSWWTHKPSRWTSKKALASRVLVKADIKGALKRLLRLAVDKTKTGQYVRNNNNGPGSNK